MKYKIAIVDDHSIFREGFKLILKHLDNAELTIEASNGKDFIEKLKTQPIDVAFLDINMPMMDGFSTTVEALKIAPNLKIITITSSENIDYVHKMLDLGVSGYMLKDAEYDEISKAIDDVMAGKSFLSNNIIVSLTRSSVSKIEKSNKLASLPKFTDRENEVLKLFCNGFSKKEIAKKLFLSDRTVEKHKERLMAKSNTNSLVGLVIFALKNEIVVLEQ